MLMVLCVIIFLLLICYSYRCIWTEKHRKILRCLGEMNGPTNLPIFGSALETFCSFSEILVKGVALSRLYKNPVSFWLFNFPFVVVYSPEDIQIIMSKVLERHETLKFLADLIGNGLITATADRWKRTRRVISSTFNFNLSTLSKSFLEVFNGQNSLLIEELKNEVNTGDHFDLWPYVFKTSFITINRTALGIQYEADVEKFADLMKKSHMALMLVIKRIVSPWLYPSILFKLYLYIKGCPNVIRDCRQELIKIVQDRKQYFDEKLRKNEIVNKESFKCLIDVLLNLREEKDLFTDEEITDEVMTVLAAGSETTALTICYTLLMLGMYQDVQDKLYEELLQVFGDSNRMPTIEDLSALTYMDQCIKETLRRFSITPVTLRTACEDITLSTGHVIPAGVTIIVPFILINWNKNLYPNPETWNPSNFEPEKVASRPSTHFMPFGLGPRSCIGGKYSMVAMKAQISTILRHFKVCTDVKEGDLVLSFDIAMRSVNGYNVQLYDRKLT